MQTDNIILPKPGSMYASAGLKNPNPKQKITARQTLLKKEKESFFIT